MKQEGKRKSIIFTTENPVNTSPQFSPKRRTTTKMAFNRLIFLQTILMFIISTGLLPSFVEADIAVKIERHFPCSPSSGLD